MTKRSKKAKKSIESLKRVIEEHFLKIEKDIDEDKIERGKYHIEEVDSSFLYMLENKINLLKNNPNYADLVKEYKERLEEYKKKVNWLDKK